MVKKRSEKYTAFIIAAALICGLPVSVSAEDASRESGPDISQLTADVETDLYQVVMPADTDGIFDFILDPQGLINETDGALHEGKSFEKNCTVFFKRSDGDIKEDYSCKSDPVTITNKSTMPVEVSLEVKVKPSSLEGIKMTEDSKFKKDKSASLYLAVVDGKKEVPVGKDGVTIRKTIGAAPDGAYAYDYDDEKEEYTYGLKKDADNIAFDEYSFQITGAANKKGDWAAMDNAVPEIVVTWKIVPKKNAELRKDAISKGDKTENALDDITEEPEESEERDVYEEPENSETDEEQAAPVENETKQEQEQVTMAGDEQEQAMPAEDEAKKEKEQVIPAEDQTGQKQPAPDDGSAGDKDPADNENENADENLNDIAE